MDVGPVGADCSSPLGREIREGNEHECPLREAGVRDDEIRVVHALVVDEEHVDIECSRSPPFATYALLGRLETLREREEIARRECGVDCDHRIEIIGLRRATDGPRLVDGGDSDNGDTRFGGETVDRGLQVCEPIPQVGPQPEKRAVTPFVRRGHCSTHTAT
jgi:hypothetical protein